MNKSEFFQNYLMSRCISIETARQLYNGYHEIQFCSFYWVDHPESDSEFIICRDDLEKDFSFRQEVRIFPAYTFEELYDFVECEFYLKKSFDPQLTYHLVSRKNGNCHNGKTALEALEKLVVEQLRNGKKFVKQSNK